MKKRLLAIFISALMLTNLFVAAGLADGTESQKIAFVGDSITYGAGVTDPAAEAYPSIVAGMLGSEYEVGNFGVSATSALSTALKPYTATEEYKASLEFDADILFIMFGTNDIKYENWTEGKDNFESDYISLIDSYRISNPEIKVYIGIPPRIFKENVYGERSPEILENEGIPAVYAVAESVGAEVVDFFTATKESPELFPDFLHPNAEGNQLFANLVYDALFAEEPDAEEPDAEEPDASLVTEGASDWAKDEIALSYAAGIVPEKLTNNYQTDITREEFCEMVVNMLPENLEFAREAAFEDCQNPAVDYAYSVGVVNGMSDSLFAPESKATRQEMAAMLYRAYKLISPDAAPAASGEYPDKAQISDWALESVNFMNENGIMLGDEDGNIMPNKNTTREQAILLVYRAYCSAYSLG